MKKAALGSCISAQVLLSLGSRFTSFASVFTVHELCTNGPS